MFENTLELEKDCLGFVEKTRVLLDNDEHELFVASAKNIFNPDAIYASYLFFKLPNLENAYLASYVTAQQLMDAENGKCKIYSLLCPKNFVALIVKFDPKDSEKALAVSVIRTEDIPDRIFPDEEELYIG